MTRHASDHGNTDKHAYTNSYTDSYSNTLLPSKFYTNENSNTYTDSGVFCVLIY